MRGSVLRNGTQARTAVTLEPARAPELAELIADAKAIFEKLDVSTRGQLVARLFIDHYQVDGRLTDPRRREPCDEHSPIPGNGRSG